MLPVHLVGVLAVQVRTDLGLGPADLGPLAAAFFSTSAGASFLAGPESRRLGSSVVVRGAAAASAVSMFLIGGLARGLLVLAAALVLGGTANGLGQPASNALIASTVSACRQGLAFGAKQASIPLSTFFGRLAVPLVAIPAAGGGLSASAARWPLSLP